eukprot:11614.XXX_341299_338499_1 [CDS] Oithona nana genome sequencing.
MDKILASLALVALIAGNPCDAARFRHPLTVPDMESFAAPNPYGFAGSYYGTPERYEMNRYAYRLGNRGSEEPEEPQAAALRVPSQEEAELQHVALEDEPVVFRRSGSYMTRMRKAKEVGKLYNKIAREFPFLVQQGLFSPGEKPSLDHLLGMTIFGQPKMGRK